MVKSELINAIAQRQKNLLPEDVELGINQIIEALSQALSRGKRIEIRGFGSFKLHYRAPRQAHNPRTGKKLVTEAKYTPRFKSGKELRDRVNAGYGKVTIQQELSEEENE